MHFLIQPGDDAPIYKQIVRQVLDALASGRLSAGDRMPSQRELALRLVIAPLTVKKAYDELERDGVLETQRGRGTFVAERSPKPSERVEQRLARLRPAVRRLLGEAYAARVSLDEVLKLVDAESARLDAQRDEQSPNRSDQ